MIIQLIFYLYYRCQAKFNLKCQCHQYKNELGQCLYDTIHVCHLIKQRSQLTLRIFLNCIRDYLRLEFETNAHEQLLVYTIL